MGKALIKQNVDRGLIINNIPQGSSPWGKSYSKTKNTFKSSANLRFW